MWPSVLENLQKWCAQSQVLVSGPSQPQCHGPARMDYWLTLALRWNSTETELWGSMLEVVVLQTLVNTPAPSPVEGTPSPVLPASICPRVRTIAILMAIPRNRSTGFVLVLAELTVSWNSPFYCNKIFKFSPEPAIMQMVLKEFFIYLSSWYCLYQNRWPWN